ncbi:hypothetical protein APSETT444_002023 [Aspergillus pseudonomiae]
MSNIELEIYEKNPKPGGTCWAPNPCWSKAYAPAHEIYAYLESVVDKHDLGKFIRFNHRCISAAWNEESSLWTTTFLDERSGEETVVRSDVLIYAVGRLNDYQIPAFEGRDKFKGRVFHTAAWPEDVDIRGKRIAVLGNGASGIQCVAGLREAYHDFRMEVEKAALPAFAFLWKHTPLSKSLRSRAESYIKTKVEDPELQQKLTPDYTPGCRRWAPGEQYINAVQQPHVKLIEDHVAALTENGFRTAQGDEYECDMIVCATGFSLYNPRVPVVGRNGITLADCWGSEGPYKNKYGKIIVPWPGTTNHYFAATEIVRWEDFDLVFEDPAQKYMSFGNGVTMDGFKPESIPWVQPPEYVN